MNQAPHPQDLQRLVALRRELHATPELSGREAGTATRLAAFLAACGPTELATGLGGHGLAAVFAAPGRTDGPTIVFRAELDALPIRESGDAPHASRTPGPAHLCGHDGHMAMLAGVALEAARRPPTRGRLVLLFQPAEETGQGARAVAADPRWRAWRADRVFAVHNLPGYPLGQVLLREGSFTAGSVGMAATLTGRTAHAAHPEQGVSPAAALARLVPGLVSLPIAHEARGDLALVTVVHARLGDPAFGVSPGEAALLATLRAEREDLLDTMRHEAEDLVRREAAADGLGCAVEWVEEFPVTRNDPAAVAAAAAAARAAGLARAPALDSPFRWSEDFGWLSRETPGALIGLGAGEAQPVLHAPDYDFPDALLPLGLGFWSHLVTACGLR
jgi:amidohydrolase